MITEKDLQEAIAECQGERNPNVNTCIKLAAFYTIQQHMFGDSQTPSYSFATTPSMDNNMVTYRGESEFAQVIAGSNSDDVWAVIDELMQTLQVLNPRLYAGVIRKLVS